MTLLVTGGCGFIGSNFVLDWVAVSDEPVVIIDKLTYAGNPSNLASLQESDQYRLIKAGIEDGGTVAAALRDRNVRAVVNFAAESHVDRSIDDPEAFFQTNVLGTLRLLEESRRYWDTLPSPQKESFRFLHVSTDEVYGTLAPDEPAFTEATPFAPNSPYAASKASSNHLARSYCKTFGLPVLTANCSNNHGPLQFPEKLIPLIIHNALAGKPLPIYGDGEQVRDWLYVRDTCSALRRVLEAGVAGETYNVGGNNQKQNIEVVRSICALLDRDRPKPDGRSYADQISHVSDRLGHDRRYALNTGKINGDLGWFPSETFESGIEKTVTWYLTNPAWVEGVTSGAYRQWIAKQYA